MSKSSKFELTEKEKSFIHNVLGTVQVNAAAPDALQTMQTLSTIIGKLTPPVVRAKKTKKKA